MLASDGKCWPCPLAIMVRLLLVSNEKTCPASWSIKIKLLETDLLGLVVHWLVLQASARCSAGADVLLLALCYGTWPCQSLWSVGAPGWQCNAGHGPMAGHIWRRCGWWVVQVKKVNDMPCASASCASGCFWMLLDAGHFWPLQVPSLSKEPLVICGTPGPRRTSQDLAGLHRGVFVTELGYGREIQASACRDQELRNSTVMWVPVYHNKSTPGPLDEAGAKCGFPGELKKLIGLSRSGSEQNFQVTLALGLESVCSVPQKNRKVVRSFANCQILVGFYGSIFGGCYNTVDADAAPYGYLLIQQAKSVAHSLSQPPLLWRLSATLPKSPSVGLLTFDIQSTIGII